MSTETNGDDVRLHHGISGEAPAAPATATTAGDDFAAAFGSDDDETPAPAEPTSTDGGEPGEQQGVDSPENGGQVPQQPQGIDLSALPEEVRQHIEAIQAAKQQLEEANAQRERDFVALQGRVAPVQQQNAQLAREIEQLRSRQQAPQQQPQPAGQPASTVAATQAQFETPEWKEYERLYPEDAGIQKRNQLALAQQMDDRIGRLEQRFETEAQRLNRIEQERVSAAKRAELDELSKAHPDWQQINESGEFWDWFNGRSSVFGFRDEADMRSRLNNSSFVSNVLDLYKASNAPQATTTPEAVIPTATTQAGAASPPDVTLALASAPRAAGAGVRRPAGGTPSAGDEFMAGFRSTDP